MKLQAVIGANYGDEGKGLVSGCLAREAYERGDRILTVFYNGTNQRAHTFEGEIHRAMAAGTKYGSDTFYHPKFVVDPISLWILQARKVFIDPECRVILPCDVMRNRERERKRGKDRHGSCGFGLYECVKRCFVKSDSICFQELSEPYLAYQKIREIEKRYPAEYDELYNLDNFMKAIAYLNKSCEIKKFDEIVSDYDTVIFEGGQGLRLDQLNHSGYPNLTPSCTGSSYFAVDTSDLSDEPIDIFYVSRSYLTRHGAGEMKNECSKDDINPDIVDQTNLPNEYQGSLRFGKLDMDDLRHYISHDLENFDDQKRRVNLVFTQLNYTDGKIATGYGRKDIRDLDLSYVDRIWVSDQKDQMEQY